MDSKDTRGPNETGANRIIRRDSHLALGCGFAFALTAVAAIILYTLLVG